ncbi:MAG: DUF4038 domain-containing protein [Acidobacteria bacterium]|nr:DUF4038 domain-containing protein [Acidobacteriota bacterium]
MIIPALRAFGLWVACAYVAGAAAVEGQRWEMEVTAPHGTEVAVRFLGPGGRRMDAPAFAIGGDRHKVRVAFPAAGRWTWQTASGNGAVRVERYSGPNPLYRHGFLRVSGNKRYLMHADGTPFLWMGDTAWYAAANASTEEWRDYIDDRVRKRFSVIQIAALRARPGGPHYFQSDGAPNPAFWDDLDAKVKHANERGLVILMIGLARPMNASERPVALKREFARHVVGRFFGDHVIFSPNFDQAYDPVFDQQAEQLRSFTGLHLLTQHPNTRAGQNEIYVPKSYLDFSGLQSGHNGGRLEDAYRAAREWALNLWRMPAVKPVINIEPMYDGLGGDQGRAWREMDVRKLGWISWLSGALGYTYGAGDIPPKVPQGNGAIWRFHQDPAAYDYWRKAIAWPSAGQMTVLRDTFARLPWWKLEPAHDLVLSPAASNLERSVLAATADRSLAVAFTPAGKPITVEMGSFHRAMKAEWVNPRDGRRHAAGRVRNSGSHEFVPPGGGDWVLLLR